MIALSSARAFASLSSTWILSSGKRPANSTNSSLERCTLFEIADPVVKRLVSSDPIDGQ